MPIFNAENQKQHGAINRYLEAKIKAPYVYSQVSTLGGTARASAIVKGSLDGRARWNNGILQNSRYFMIRIDRSGAVEMFAKSYLLKKMRMVKAASLPDAVLKINKWIGSVK